MTSCSASQKTSGQKLFNKDEFPGLVQIVPDSKSIMLDCELDGTDGQLLKFTSCSQVNATQDDEVIPHQFKLLRLLRIDCRTADIFLNSDTFSRSFFPQSLTGSFPSALPAQTVPSRGGDDLDMRKGALMGGYEKNLRIDNNRLTLTLTDGEEIT